MKRLIVVVILVLFYGTHLQAEAFDLPAHQEAEYQDITRSLRCLTCEAQSVFESDTPMAIAVKNYVKESLANHQSEQEIRDYLHERYGDAIFFEVRGFFLDSALWFVPAILFLGGIIFLVMMNRRRAL